MRLVELTANQPTFRPVRFNRTGLSFVVGERHREVTRDRTKTYNGVGKSLMLDIVSYCLGAKQDQAFARQLQTWSFTLRIELAGVEHSIERDAATGDTRANGNEISATALKDWLHHESFDDAETFDGIGFRSLLSPFLRSGKDAYSQFDRTGAGDGPNPYAAFMRMAFLLGLDLRLAENKYRLKKRRNLLTTTMKALEAEPLFDELLADEATQIELVELREQEAQLESSLRRFQVARDYEAIQQEADAAKRSVELLRREAAKVSDAVGQIDRSLTIRTDLDPAAVSRLYEESQASLPELVRRQIEDVLAFHRELQRKRTFRLTAERQHLETRRRDVEREIATLAGTIEDRIQYLGTHVALDEYAAVSQRLGEVRQRIARLEAAQEQRERVTQELRTIDVQQAQESIRTDEYLVAARPLVEEASNLFRAFSRELYGARAGLLTVNNDTGDNLIRYRIDAHIPADRAEGINEAKIFCYDLMLLALKRRHAIEFLAHDSTLFSPVDSRQRWAMIQLADRLAREQGLQYIATMNEHDISSMRPETPTEREEFDRLFGEPNVVLRLTDSSPAERLLGIEVDLARR
jgi:uncharacterized protein YydD (DUF2326 family)